MAGTETVDSGASNGQQRYESGDTDDDDDCGFSMFGDRTNTCADTSAIVAPLLDQQLEIVAPLEVATLMFQVFNARVNLVGC
ncbi:hypothetical protein Acr_20g0005710 [Actinidia rufa]|uniref:Uncharacterized protein n=1 Tax=Actinidia rufa TaxID=165716 RepID=A0A7J0GD91_9ERIC|nr:hypothetical protein Acr_20g0005710 [Actinidia rufa]